jgi:hypothetical protein
VRLFTKIHSDKCDKRGSFGGAVSSFGLSRAAASKVSTIVSTTNAGLGPGQKNGLLARDAVPLMKPAVFHTSAALSVR